MPATNAKIAAARRAAVRKDRNMNHEYVTLTRCAQEIETTRFETWAELRAFKAKWYTPRVRLRIAVRRGTIAGRRLFHRRVRLVSRLALCARDRVNRTARNWRLLGYASDEAPAN